MSARAWACLLTGAVLFAAECFLIGCSALPVQPGSSVQRCLYRAAEARDVGDMERMRILRGCIRQLVQDPEPAPKRPDPDAWKHEGDDAWLRKSRQAVYAMEMLTAEGMRAIDCDQHFFGCVSRQKESCIPDDDNPGHCLPRLP